MRLKNSLWIAILVALYSVSANADRRPTIEHLTSDNGLSHNTIRCMLQDKTGFLWFGSLYGLNRYDGIRIKSLKPDLRIKGGLSSGKIRELHQDGNGHIWLRTYTDRMHCYDPSTEKFINYTDDKEEQSIKHNFYYEDLQKNVWLGSMSAGCTKITFADGKFESKIFRTNQGENALPSDNISDIFEDTKLNTWVMTAKGYVRIKGDKIASREVGVGYTKAVELNKKVYLISTRGDVSIYNLANSKFEGTFPLKFKSSVFKVATVGDGFIAISTYGSGVYFFNVQNHQFTTDEWVFGEKLTGNAYFQKDRYGALWAYNFTGNAWMVDSKTYKVNKLNLIPPSVLQLIDEERYQFLGDKHGNVWISTYGNGLFCYNRATSKVDHYNYSKDANSLASNYLLAIAFDVNENIWVGTESMGINKLSFTNRNVTTLHPDPDVTIKNGNVIKAFLEDKNGNVWVSTKAGNLFEYDPTLTSKKTIINNGYNVNSMYQDKAGSIWLATKRYGIVEFKGANPANPIFYQSSTNRSSLSNNTVFSLLKDRKGRLWAATFGGGVCVKTTAEGKEGFRTFFNEDEFVRFTRFIMMDKRGDLWVATSNGVLRFNPDALLKDHNAYRYYSCNAESENSLSNPEVRYIFEDSRGSIWLATAGGGLNKFIGETPQGNGQFKVYDTRQGMMNDNIMAIQEDRTGCLWISTESGLHKLNILTNLFQFYKFSDDFSSNLFSEASAFTCRSGRMLWGSLNGFYAFYPKNLLEKQVRNNVVLTGFNIFDQDAKIAESGAPLKESVSIAKKIVLTSADKVFSIEFANLNFRDPKANQFMYILDNFEKRWNVSGSYNVATYRNVPPGKYNFQVKSVNSDGVWDTHVTSLEIVIKPPFWQSTIAIILYIILLGALAYFAFNLVLKFNRLNNAVKLERQLTDYKLRFFTNISHEFRTPLTLIKGSVDTLNELKSKLSEPFQHLVGDLDKNTSHLMRLIDQLLEFRKLQNNKQKLNLQRIDAVLFLKEIFNSFTDVAGKMNIEYKFIPSQTSIPIYIDRNKVDKIVFNLLSNAFKFTPRGGKITLIAEVEDTSQQLRISVVDNGIGVPVEKQSLLFSRFMQINFSSAGTGIGLSLVNEFTSLHKGSVYFSENEGGGSIFTVELSMDSSIYTKDEFVNEQIVVSKEDKQQVYNLSEFFQQNDSESLINLVAHQPIAGKKYKVLVIDDNDDIREFLYGKLSPYFEVIMAEDGESGIQRSMDDDPDLIICDVMMPGMNGFELTRKLKDDFATCHIPVILLTAYIADEHNTEGIEAGADAYISKPFSMNHLMLQINKLLEKRERLHKHYVSNETTTVPLDEVHLELPDRDGLFLQLVEELLEKHLTNPDFSVDDFAQMTNTGRTLFFKKIKYLTGYTPNEFIRVRRMKKAAELLETMKYNVSEVSYMVGINDPFYFSKCFRTQYGCSPSRYKRS